MNLHVRTCRRADANVRAKYLVLWVTIASTVTLGACNPITDSHIDMNVPAAAEFDALLERDLQEYFAKALGNPIRVKYSLLRRGPTQTGTSYPKYYAWVVVHADSSNSTLAEGAVRVAAVERVRFEVTDFVSKPDIVQKPELITSVFPDPVCDEIKKRL